MNRRAFLTLRTRGRERVMELSCQRLYMRWTDASSRAGAPVAAEGTDGEREWSADSWDGEPPAEIETETVGALWAELDHGLARCDVLVVSDHAWLADPVFGREVESRIEDFRERAGRVE